MEKIVSLARRRGFVFPSSEIYGGLGSAYDYGHYGVLMKENVKARWLEAMVRERDDIVALDSSIILHPRVWEASGHVAGFSDPLVDCRHCKRRYRADHLDQSRVRRAAEQASRRDASTATSPRRASSTSCSRRASAPVEETGLDAYLRPETAQGIFVNFKNVAQIDAAQAAVRDRADRQGVPERDHARELHLPHARVRADGDGVLRPARRGGAVVPRTGSTSACAGTSASGIREEQPARPRRTRPTSSRTTRAGRATSSTSSPSAGRSSRAIANRGDFDLSAHTEASGTKLEWVDSATGERYVPHVIEPAAGVNRSMLAFLVDAYDEEVVAERAADGAAAAPAARAGEGRGAAADSPERGHRAKARGSTRSSAARSSRSTTTPARSAGATGARTRSERRTRSRSTSRRSRTTRSRSATATRSSRSGSRSPGARELVLDRLAQEWQPPKTA